MVQRAGTFLTVATGLLSTVLVIAQQDTTPAPPRDRSAAAPTQTAEITIRGCVSGETRYTFMQSSTGAMFALTGESSRFAPVRGKLVEITADEFAPQDHSRESATAPYADPGIQSQTPPNVNNPNISGDTGAPSPGTGNPPNPPQ